MVKKNGKISKEIIEISNSPEYNEIYQYYNTPGLFNYIGMTRKEEIHSNFLAWLLDAKKEHNLQDYTIRKFLELLIIVLGECRYVDNDKNLNNLFPEDVRNYIIIGDYKVIDSKVLREELAEGDKIDIFVELLIEVETNDEHKKIKINIIIENKVKSKENDNQTEKYYNWAKNEFNNGEKLIFVYLTPHTNKELFKLDTQLCKNKNYIQINYQHIVDYLLEPCKKQQMSEESRYLIDSYLRCLTFPSVENENNDIIMAISKSEKDRLMNFWSNNKELFLTAMKVATKAKK